MYPGPDTFLQYYIGPYLQARHLKQGRLGIQCNVQFKVYTMYITVKFQNINRQIEFLLLQLIEKI